MKRILIILMFSVSGSLLLAQNSIDETQKLATLCKVWGFLKYYHPQVAKGKFDWDAELIKKIPQIKSANTKEEINKIYVDWIDGLGKVKKRKTKTDTVGLFSKNFDLSWISESSGFNEDVVFKLNFIKENRARKHYYASNSNYHRSFKNEKEYNDSVFPSEGLRFIALSRYWNVINYYFPYKYKMDENWNDVLIEMIPEFMNPNDTLSYHLSMKKLTMHINDNHSKFEDIFIDDFYGNKCVPVKIKVINKQVIVVGFLNDSLGGVCGLNNGDILKEINGIDLNIIISDKIKYINYGNESTKWRNLSRILLRFNSDSIQISYERNHQIQTKYIKCFANFNISKNVSPEYKELEDNIGYVNQGLLTNTDVDIVMDKMQSKKAIIIDMRNYPKATAKKISYRLNNKINPFARYIIPDEANPGMFIWSRTYFAGEKTSRFKRRFPKKERGYANKNYYKGLIVLLINEETQSQAEYACMAFQTAPNIILIGSQTAGADGDVRSIMFPGNFRAYFSGRGVYYPDGRETQRIGIVPDIEIKPTIKGIQEGRDEVLERALEYINRGK